jgi:hypothetical protein
VTASAQAESRRKTGKAKISNKNLSLELLLLWRILAQLQLLRGPSCQMPLLQITHQSLIFRDQLWASSFATLDF